MPLDTWRRLGPLDLNDINEIHPIDLSKELVYQERDISDGKVFGQYKDDNAEGIQRKVFRFRGEYFAKSKTRIQEG